MKIIDEGHAFILNQYDGETYRPYIIFMKRFGANYPFNTGSHPGTNCQEVLRALISRINYLQKQIWCYQNWILIKLLRICIWLFEYRAARRHKRRIPFYIKNIELLWTCPTCGHIYCEGKHKK